MASKAKVTKDKRRVRLEKMLKNRARTRRRRLKKGLAEGKIVL